MSLKSNIEVNHHNSEILFDPNQFDFKNWNPQSEEQKITRELVQEYSLIAQRVRERLLVRSQRIQEMSVDGIINLSDVVQHYDK